VQDTFINLFIEYTKEFESPTSFWKWSAYGAVAASLRFNCSIKWGTGNLYPNMYILLLADSAAYRKDAGPELVEELLKENGHTKVIAGRISWPAVVDELSQDRPAKKGGIPIRGGGAIIIATEFTAAFVEDASLIKQMTESHGYKEEFDYILRGTGTVKIKNRCITMLGGSNETLLRDLYGQQATYGGLLRRTCLVKPDRRRPPNSLTDDDSFLTLDKKKTLCDKLKTIQNLKGLFTLSDEAKKYYKEWYNDLYNSYDKLDDRTGFIQGIHSLIIKLAMILAANEGRMQISDEILKTAIHEIEALKENYAAYTMAAGKNPNASMGTTILCTLWTAHNTPNGTPRSLKRRDLLLKYWNEISAEELDKLLFSLEQAGLLRMIPSGQEPSYVLTQVAMDSFLKNQKTISKSAN
jgi:hypothetical protein